MYTWEKKEYRVNEFIRLVPKFTFCSPVHLAKFQFNFQHRGQFMEKFKDSVSVERKPSQGRLRSMTTICSIKQDIANSTASQLFRMRPQEPEFKG
ncbi:hypothetical protein TNCV_1445521 [Trichonephila clavipes]|nr:hypothetical protein TNCV_1445521 [Trichonephila clavipes]